MYFSKKSSVYSWALIRQTKYLLMMTKKRSTKIVNFFIPVAGGLVQGYGRISHSVKMHYFFIRLLFFFRALIRQTKYIVIMTNKCLQKLQIINSTGWEFCSWARSYKSHGDWTCIIFFQNLLLYFRPWIRKRKYLVMLTKEGLPKLLIS